MIDTSVNTDSVETISRDELARALDDGAAQVVNVLERPEVGRLRLIPGSIHVPFTELDEQLERVDRSRDVILYCKNPMCSAARIAAAWLAPKGYRVRVYEGGINDWVAAGLPTTSDEPTPR